MNENNQQGQQAATSQPAAQQSTQGGNAGAASVEAMPGLAAAQEQREQQQAGAAATPPPTPASGLSPEQISALVKTAVGEVAQQHAPQEAPEITMAKFEKAFNVYKFDPERLTRLGYTQEQIADVLPIYEELRDGFVRQAVTMSNYQIGLLKEELMKTFQPAIDVARQQMEERLKAEFLATNKDLVGYEPLLEEIKNKYVAQNRSFKSKEELFTTISSEARTIIDKVLKAGNTGGAGGAAGTVNGAQTQSHRMSTVAAGGQGGAGAATTTSGDKPGWLKALE